jgi:uncharacterized protein YecT (DUF1311 family)
MTALFRLLVVLALLAASSATLAQYNGPGVGACNSFAEAQLKKAGTNVKQVVFDQDADLVIERVTQKIGSQFVSSLLRGNGAVIYASGASFEMRFTCLLANDKQAVFFDWRSRPDASPLAHCRRAAPAGQSVPRCLDDLLLAAENELGTVTAQRFQEAREMDSRDGLGRAEQAYRGSLEAWKAFREQECSRRRIYASGGKNAADEHLSCMVELARQHTRVLAR